METIAKRCLSSPTKPSAKRAKTFASPTQRRHKEKLQENNSGYDDQVTVSAVSSGQITFQALTNVVLEERQSVYFSANRFSIA